jgi:hypothetical protein
LQALKRNTQSIVSAQDDCEVLRHGRTEKHDTEVFFKLMLAGYIENINSGRKIIETAQMRPDMLYFLGYDIDEPLPWHSTLCV